LVLTKASFYRFRSSVFSSNKAGFSCEENKVSTQF